MPNNDEYLYGLLREQHQQITANLKSFAPFKVLPRVVLAYIKQLSAKLRRIEEALARWQQDTYGVCLLCMREINREHLITLPYAELCLNCQQAQEEEKAYGMKPIY